MLIFLTGSLQGQCLQRARILCQRIREKQRAYQGICPHFRDRYGIHFDWFVQYCTAAIVSCSEIMQTDTIM